MAVMNAEDYLDALQSILKLKINRKQNTDVAVVLVECCAQEQTFNKFYVFLIEKLIEIRKEMKFCVQYSLWDHFKLLENYTLRKICNLAKISGFLVQKKVLGLGVLKGLDLDEKNQHHFLFMKTFLKSFLEKNLQIEKNNIAEIARKIKQNEENVPFCQSLYDYIKQKIYFELRTEEKHKEFCEKIKYFLKVLKPEI